MLSTALNSLETPEDRRKFLMNVICFATCIEGLFFFAAFAYVYFLRSKGLLTGLASGTNWVFRDESMHIAFANEVIQTARREEPSLFNEQMNDMVVQMMEDAIECEMAFAEDILEHGVAGMSLKDMRQYLEFVADQRLESLHIAPRFNVRNPFGFMELQDMQELANFFVFLCSDKASYLTGEKLYVWGGGQDWRTAGSTKEDWNRRLTDSSVGLAPLAAALG